MERQYFGTDGIRGCVGEPPMTPDFVLKLGWAAGQVLKHYDNKVLIGKDTRVSGYMFEAALEAGFSAAGMDVLLLGPMPTPAVAYLTRAFRAALGVVVSASHNPYQDNGIKFFSQQGMKLSDAEELAIEDYLSKPLMVSKKPGKAQRIDDAKGRYIEFCKRHFPLSEDLHGLRLVVDCAHGATYAIAPPLFHELGAEVLTIGTEPNGFNINDGVGATDLAALQKKVLASKADLGIALDGDGDRLMLIDNQGELVDGDEILFIIARARQEQKRYLPGVVGTQMSNLGLEQALSRLGIAFKRAKVGDRYVLEQLLAHNWEIGGETSGHILCLDSTSTGDGLIAALQVLAYMRKKNKTLHELKQGMIKFPQLLTNFPLPVPYRLLSEEKKELLQALAEEQQRELAGRGRIVLRPSGTEPLLRLLVEGETITEVESRTLHLAAAIKTLLSA